jgi:pimeloyl-ACP methyl ester carboxylesterase
MTEVKGSVELVRSADGTGISTLAGQGHEVMLDAPELFAREVTRFLAER